MVSRPIAKKIGTFTKPMPFDLNNISGHYFKQSLPHKNNFLVSLKFVTNYLIMIKTRMVSRIVSL